MKLAEALQERADLNRQISQLEDRLQNNVTVQEGEKTAEDPEELMRELDEKIGRLNVLIAAINLRNCSTVLDGRSLTELMADRDCLRIKISAYQEIVSQASRLANRALRSEIKVMSAVNVREIQKKVDAMSGQLRRIDNRIQEANWTTEL